MFPNENEEPCNVNRLKSLYKRIVFCRASVFTWVRNYMVLSGKEINTVEKFLSLLVLLPLHKIMGCF